MESLFNDPIQVLGLVFILITFSTQMILGIKLYRDYLQTKSTTLRAFSLTFISWGLSLLFLTLERISLFEIENVTLGLVFAYIALIISVFAILTLDIFASYATFPQHVKKLMVVSLILAIIFLFILSLGGIAEALPPLYEVTFPAIVRTAMLYTLVPLFIYPVAVLAYYALRMRERSPPHAKQATIVTIAIICVILIYFLEVIGWHETINWLRGLYVVATLLFFISFTRLYELAWPNKVRQLYVTLAEKGICLYDHSFVGKKRMESNIVTGFITGLIILVQEITETDKKLKIVDVEDVKIMLEHGKRNVVGILLTEENLKILRNKLRDFVDAFELEFERELTRFTGSVDEFQRTKELVERIFAHKAIF